MENAKEHLPCPGEYTSEEWAEYHRDPCAWCIKELRNTDPSIRCNAAEILRGLAWDAVAAIPALIEGCQDSNEQVRAYCAHALVDIGYAVHARAPAALPSLIAAVPILTVLLSDQSMDVRCAAAYALQAIGSPAHVAIPALQSLLDDSELEMRDCAQSALATIQAAWDQSIDRSSNSNA